MISVVLHSDCFKSTKNRTDSVGSRAASLSAVDVRKMWRTAEERFMRHVNLSEESIPAKFKVFFLAKTFNSWRDQRDGKGELLSWESQSSSNIARVDVWVVNQRRIRMIFRRKFCVPKFGVLARSKQLIFMRVTVKFRLDFSVCGLQGHLLWHLSVLAPCFHATKNNRSNEELSRFSF